MKLYLVKGIIYVDDVESDFLYGIFSSIENANKIANNLRKSIEKINSEEIISIQSVILDEPREVYYYTIS